MGKKAKGGDSITSTIATSAPVGLSDDLAELVNKKIREFEQGNKVESEKTTKGQKAKAQAAAKTKVKDAKKLLEDSSVPGSEKIAKLWERLQAEHEQATGASKQSIEKRTEIDDAEKAQFTSQNELTRALGVQGKLETLCRSLQQQTNALVDERRRLSDMERQRRQELADEFQHTIGDVKKTMDQQAQERSRLARENEELRSRFKKFFEEYDTREKERQEQQRSQELEVQVSEARLAEQTKLYRQESAKETAASRDNEELTNTEEVLRGQLLTYSNKFNHFQDALSKSDKVLGQYKRQRNKMQRRVEAMEKENVDLKGRNERKMITLTKEKEALGKEKGKLQDTCKQLQADRQKFLEEEAKAQDQTNGS